MPTPLLVFAALAVAAFCGADPGAAKAPPQVVEWLDKLEARGREIKSFAAKVQYEKTDELLKSRLMRTGEAVYLAGQGGEEGKPPTRFAVLFERYIADGKLQNQKLEYIFDGEWLVEKDHKQKRFEKRQVVAPGASGRAGALDPLSIDGPFPLPLGQKREQVLQRFEVAIVEDEPAAGQANPLHLQLTPRQGAPALRDQKKFDRVDLWFDRETLLPVKVQTDEGAAVTTVTLSQARVNDIPQADVVRLIDTTPPRPGEGWRVEIKPWDE